MAPRKNTKKKASPDVPSSLISGTVDVSTPDKFCEAWTAADTLKELVNSTSITQSTLTGRAAAYRRRGIALKFFRSGGNRYADWSALAQKYKSKPDAASKLRKPASKRKAA
jgi:hypothetical protein